MKQLILIYSCVVNLLFHTTPSDSINKTIIPLKSHHSSKSYKPLSKFPAKEFVRNFMFVDDKGQPQPLLDTTKKVNMVVFWASWCSPCRMEIPNLKKIFAHIDQKNFRLISISVDKDKGAWIKAVNEEQMPWPQLLAEGDNVKGIKEDFGFTGIPQIYFIDNKGKVLAGYTGYHYDNGAGLEALVDKYGVK